MERQFLLDALASVAPALSRSEVLPALQCLWFDGESVSATDGVVMAREPVRVGLKGGVQGKPLLDWLKGSSADEVGLVADPDAVTFKAGRSRITLPILEGSPLESTEQGFVARIPVQDNHLAALRQAHKFMGYDLSDPWRAGITVSIDEHGQVLLYATDNVSLIEVSFPSSDPGDTPPGVYNLNPRFMDLLVRRPVPESMELSESTGLFVYGGGGTLSGRMIEEADVGRYQETFDWAYEGDASYLDVTEEVRGVLKRVADFAATTDHKLARLRISDGVGTITAKRGTANLVEEFDAGEHADVAVHFSPTTLMRRLAGAEEIHCGADAFSLVGSSWAGLVSVASEDG